MVELIARRVAIDTASQDNCGALLFIDGRLVACLVQLADDIHGDLCGQWYVEMVFGSDMKGLPDTFREFSAAVAAITQRLTGKPLFLTEPMSDLPI